MRKLGIIYQDLPLSQARVSYRFLLGLYPTIPAYFVSDVMPPVVFGLFGKAKVVQYF